MTKNQFAAICEEYMIAPCIALENKNVIAALKGRNVAKLRKVLETEF